MIVGSIIALRGFLITARDHSQERESRFKRQSLQHGASKGASKADFNCCSAFSKMMRALDWRHPMSH
jgi:hypothetical protein